MPVSSGSQLVIFKLSDQRYAVPVNRTSEIIRMVDITPVPRSDAYVEGIINLRGKVVPVLNLHRKMGLPEGERSRDSRIVVIENGEERIGMIVDGVDEVSTYEEDELDSPPSVAGDNPFIKGVVKRKEDLWLLLDLDRVVGPSSQAT
ncbi:MAG: chemotaxis protein CheW [Peptococcaceae bacterium]|nr:chemotaxis protein CheW [Peptococcaceae bacterium]